MDINEIIGAVDQRFKKDEYVLISVEEWQTLKIAMLGTTHNQQLKAEIVEDLSEIESHSQFIQRKSVRVRELVWRLSHI